MTRVEVFVNGFLHEFCIDLGRYYMQKTNALCKMIYCVFLEI